MLNLIGELILDIVAFAAIIGFLLTWLWDKSDRTDSAILPPQEDDSPDEEAKHRDAILPPWQKAG